MTTLRHQLLDGSGKPVVGKTASVAAYQPHFSPGIYQRQHFVSAISDSSGWLTWQLPTTTPGSDGLCSYVVTGVETQQVLVSVAPDVSTTTVAAVRVGSLPLPPGGDPSRDLVTEDELSARLSKLPVNGPPVTDADKESYVPSRLADSALKAAYAAVITPESHGAPATYAAGHDDTAAVQAAVTDAITHGATLALSRVYNITAPVTGSGRLIARGAGAHDNTGNLVTGLLMQTDAVDGLVLTGANGSVLRDFGIKSAVTTPTGGAALRFAGTGAADFARLTDLVILNCYDGLVVEDGTYYKIRGVDVYDPVRYGMRFLTVDGERFDHGDQTVSGCTIARMFVATRSGGTALRWESGGGLRFTDNKINGLEQPFQANAQKFQYGLDLAVRDGGATSVLLISSNSIENCTDNLIQVRQGGTTGQFSKISIVGNELNNSNYGIALSSSAPATNSYVGTATITGNAFTAFYNSIALANVSNVHIGGNVHIGLGGPAVALSGTNTDVHMDSQVFSGENKTLWYDEDAANSPNGHGPYATARFVLEREVPATTSASTYTHLYRLSVGQYSGGVIEVNLGGNVNGAGGYTYQGKFTYLRAANGTAVTVTAAGTPITAGQVVDVTLDTATTVGDVIIGVKLNPTVASAGGTDVCGRASITVNGPLYQLIKGA